MEALKMKNATDFDCRYWNEENLDQWNGSNWLKGTQEEKLLILYHFKFEW